MIANPKIGQQCFYLSHHYPTWDPGPGRVIGLGKRGAVVRFDRFRRHRSVKLKNLYATVEERQAAKEGKD